MSKKWAAEAAGLAFLRRFSSDLPDFRRCISLYINVNYYLPIRCNLIADGKHIAHCSGADQSTLVETPERKA
jgi:hypothetical protein